MHKPVIISCRYVNKGYQYAYIRHFDGMEKGHVVAKLVEGRVNKVSAVYVDEDGHPKRGGGEVPDEVILREMPFKVRSKLLGVGTFGMRVCWGGGGRSGWLSRL